MPWVRSRLCKLQKRVHTQLATTSDQVYQLLAHGRWFSPASSITIAEILLKVVLKHQKSIKSDNVQNLTFSEFLAQKLIYSEFHDFVVIGNCKSNYHLITVTTIPFNEWSL